MTSAISNAGIVGFFCVIRRICMLIGISLILISGLLLGWLCKKVRFPALFGMIIAGVLL